MFTPSRTYALVLPFTSAVGLKKLSEARPPKPPPPTSATACMKLSANTVTAAGVHVHVGG